MNKTNIIVDFSNIAMRALFTCSYSGVGEISTFDTDKECEILVRKICMDLAYVTRIFSPERVIIACDARHPWRNDLYDPSEDEGYKSNRVKDNTKNWDKIFRTLNELKEILKERDFIVTEIPTAEGDDVAALWKKNCFDNSENVVLISSDKDWTQLVDFNNNKKFCICFNPISNNKGKKKLYCTQSLIDWMNEETKTDIFFTNYNPNKEELKNIKSKDVKIEYEVINPNKVVLEKIFCGDDGDNAPAFYQYYKDGKKTRITPKKAEKICEDLNIFTVKDLCDCNEANMLKPKIESVLKKDLDIDSNERLLRQRRLVELNPELFPSEINSAFQYHLKDSVDKGYIARTYELKMDYILKDTKFLSPDYNKPKENEIFTSLKDLDNILATSKNLF